MSLGWERGAKLEVAFLTFACGRFDLGVAFRVKYGHLLKGFTDTLPVFRTTSNGMNTDSYTHLLISRLPFSTPSTNG